MILHLIWKIAVDAFAVVGAGVITAGLYAHFCIPDEYPPMPSNSNYLQDAQKAQLDC